MIFLFILFFDTNFALSNELINNYKKENNDLETLQIKAKINNNDTFAEVVVDSGVTLTISAAGSLNVTGNLTNNGAIVMESSATNSSALVVSGSIAGSSGSWSYQKYAAAYNTTNDLIAPPFFGLSFTNTLSLNGEFLIIFACSLGCL